MSSIMDLNALGFVELLGASSRVQNSRRSQLSCFFNPNILPPKSQSRSLTTAPYSSLLPCSLPSFRRDCALRLRVRAATTKDDIGESSGETKHSNLRANMSPLHPHYIEYGLIYYKVLVQCCQTSWMLKLNSQIPGLVRKDIQACLRRIVEEFSISDIKKITKITNHDHVKAAAQLLKHKCRSHPHIDMVVEYLPLIYNAEYINDLAQALMLVEVIKIVKFHVLADLTDKICDLILMDDFLYAGNIANSKTLVEKCAVRLRKEMHTIFELETKLMEKFKLAEAVRNYLNHGEDQVVASNSWPKIFHKGRISVFETHDYTIELHNAFIQFNNILEPFGKLVCECLTCYDFKQQQMMTTTTTTTSTTMHIDDFENIQENLRLGNLGLYELMPPFMHLKFVGDMSSESMRNMAVGFERSLIAYRSIWRGMEKFNRKISEARLSSL